MEKDKQVPLADGSNKSKRVKIVISPTDDPNDKIVTVGVNNDTYRIERGKEVEVPDYVVDVLSVKKDIVRIFDGKREVHQVPSYPFSVVG